MTAMAGKLDVFGTVGSSWRCLATNPGAALRTAWPPFALMLWLSLSGGGEPAAVDPDAVIGDLAEGAVVVAVMILSLVAWQRLVLYGADRRRGLISLRLGRAELLSLVHFPLVLILFVPLQLWPLVDLLYSAPTPGGRDIAAWMPWIAFAITVFPGGPFLARAALMLAAIAAAGGRRAPLSQTANGAWSAGAGNTIRIFLTLMLAGLPIALAAQALDATGWSSPPLLAACLRSTLLLLYVLIVGGALAGAWQMLGGMDNSGGARQSPDS